MKTLLLCAIFACAFVYSFAAVVNDACTVQSSGCLGGMVVTANYTPQYQPCRDRIVYTFTKLGGGGHCGISNFVTNGAQPYSTTCSDLGSQGYNKVFCPGFGAIFDNPYKINTDSCSGTNTVVVDMVVPQGDFVPGVIGVKGGTDCTTCSLYTYKPAASNVVSLGGCTQDSDCNDDNTCTTDTCVTGNVCSGGTCKNVWTSDLCVPCKNDTDCTDSAPQLDACTVWGCNQNTQQCARSKIPNCYPCVTKADCPPVGETGATCLENQCVNGECVEGPVENIESCCTQDSTTTVDACYTCTKKTGCGFSDSLQCVPTNSSSGLPTTNDANQAKYANCSTFTKTGDGGDGGGTDGGTIAAIVVPVVAATVLAALAALTFGVALAFLIAKHLQRGQMVSQLQAMGFNEDEANKIMNSGAYKETGGENPFFITTDDTGAKIIKFS